ncbi:hypothetical protein [Qipengyuania vulgaris]|nr:hypothetical protein [Qipengyuania vulgaris]
MTTKALGVSERLAAPGDPSAFTSQIVGPHNFLASTPFGYSRVC